MDNSQLRTYIRQLIIEAKEAKAKKVGKPELKTKKKVTVSDHIKMIEEAGEEAGKQAKTAEIEIKRLGTLKVSNIASVVFSLFSFGFKGTY
jgi:hypothetical protein